MPGVSRICARATRVNSRHLGRLPRPDALGWDRFARQARLDDTARRCFTALERRDPETAAWVRAYVDGVNQGLPEGARRAPEFATVGLAPGRWEPWTTLGVRLATHILFAGFPAKLRREEAVRHLGPDRHRRAGHRRRPPPLHRGPRRLPADPPVLPGVRRHRPRGPGRSGLTAPPRSTPLVGQGRSRPRRDRLDQAHGGQQMEDGTMTSEPYAAGRAYAASREAVHEQVVDTPSTPTTPTWPSWTAGRPRSSRRTSPRPTGSASAMRWSRATSASIC